MSRTLRAARRRIALPLALSTAILLAAALAPGSAVAATTCKYESAAEVLQVAIPDATEGVVLAIGFGGKIVVRDYYTGSNLACSGGVPTLGNTGAVTVTDTSGSGAEALEVSDPASFAATTEIIYAPGPEDALILGGTAGDDYYWFGATGVDTNNKAGRDITFLGRVPEYLGAVTGAGVDHVFAVGSTATGGPVPSTSKVTIIAGPGNDNIAGGEGEDFLEGGTGNDFLSGKGGGDAIVPDEGDAGDDHVFGDPGEQDIVIYEHATHPVTVDLPRERASGEGDDILEGVGAAVGSPFADHLIGTEADNFLNGEGGDDLLEGGGGDDTLLGGLGEDTVSFAAAAGPVTANLETHKASGQGEDTLNDDEDLIGSPFGDRLTGDAKPNRILGGAGSDTVAAGAGDDLVEVRDGVADQASCGDGADRAIADRRSLDTLAADCESVDALAEGAGQGGGGGGAGSGGGAGPGGAPPAATCVVPKLKGFGLRADRKRLSRAGCRLGQVRGRHGRHAKVVKQGIPAGTVRPAGAKVSVKLGG
jgi:Ca2+-binding RTX toxin-like protein